MKLSRRQFLYATGASVAATALPQMMHALPNSSEIRMAYAAITWGDDLSGAITDISAVGYKGIQLRANVVKLMPDPLTVKDELAKHNLQFTALSSGDVALDPSEEAANLALHENNAKYLHAAGGSYLQIIGTFRKNGQFTDDEYKRTAILLTEIGKRTADHGVQLALHNHMGGIAQAPDQLAKIMDAANPQYVKLLLDVAHYKQGGGDPVNAVKLYADRILFLHFKDVKPAATANGYEFVEIGQGTVDLPGVVAALRAIRFQGWAVVELDREPTGSTRTPKESAQMSKNYLEHTLKVHV